MTEGGTAQEIHLMDRATHDKTKVHVSPVARLLESLDGTYYTTGQVAKMIGCSQATVRTLIKNDRVKAPSKVAVRGQGYVYLFTPEDVEEVRDFLGLYEVGEK